MAVIVNINHETGDLSQYTSTVTDSGDLSVTAGAALAGTSYGLSCLIDDTTAIYGQKTVTTNTSGILRIRLYIDPNALTMGNGSEFMFLLSESSAGLSGLSLWLNYSSGYRLTQGIYNDAGGATYGSYYAISDAPHYVELLLTRATNASSNDGSLQLWIDGNNTETLSGIDNYDRDADFNSARTGMIIGSYLVTTSGTFFLDELVVNDDGSLIGPTLNNYTLTAGVGSFALSGVDVGILRTYVLAPDVGSYALTGVDAFLSYMSVSNAIGRVSAHTISPYNTVASNIAVSDLSESESANSVESSEV